MAGYQPGFLYGVLAGFVFSRRLRRSRAARLNLVGAARVLMLSVVAWIVWTPFGHQAAHPDPGTATLVLDAFLAAVFVAGIQTIVFGFVPLRFLPGEPAFRIKRAAWAAIYAAAMFAFVHVLLHPGVDYPQAHTGHGFAITLTLLIAFASLSLLLVVALHSRTRTGELTPQT